MRQFSQITIPGTVGSTAIGRLEDDLPKIPRRFLAYVKALNVNGKTCVVLCIRTDNGGEYTGAEFENILLEHLIRQEYSNPSEQFQNGVSERSNGVGPLWEGQFISLQGYQRKFGRWWYVFLCTF